METLITRAVGALGWWFFSCLVCYAAWRLWKNSVIKFVNTLGYPKMRIRSRAEREAASLADKVIRPKDPRAGYAKLISMFIAILVASWTVSGWIAVVDHREIKSLKAQLAKYDASTVIEHNFTPVRELEDGDFAYFSDEKRIKGDTFRVCPADKKNGVDTADILRQGLNHVAEYAIWEERGTCRSILRSDLGFWWRDANNKFTYTKVEEKTNAIAPK